MIRKAKKKPVEITFYTFEDIIEIFDSFDIPFIVLEYVNRRIGAKNSRITEYITFDGERKFVIKTLEGYHEFTKLDVLIIGVRGEIYPCKIDIFEETYDLVRESEETKCS